MKNCLVLLLCLFSFNCIIGQVTIKASMPANLPTGKISEIEVKINKGSIANFAKYQMDVPAGITVMESDSRSGNFTFENSRAKIVWVSVPPDPEFTIKLKLQANNSAPSQANIVQKFYYLDNGTKKEVEADVVMLSVGANNAVATNYNETPPVNTKVEPVKTEPVKTEPAFKEPAKTEPAKTEPVVKTEPVKKEPVKTEPVKTEPVKTEPVKTEPAKTEPVTTAKTSSASADGFIYKVQLSAGSTDPGKSKFAALGGSKIVISKEDGLYKVLYGSFNSKEEALKAKDEAAAKGFNGFVVKYKDGVRVK